MFRLLAIIAVIILHVHPFRAEDLAIANILLENYQGRDLLAVLMDQFSRFAVPFFFVIAGYFWGTKIRSGFSLTSVSASMAKRIGFMFIAWSLIYLLPYDIRSIADYGLLGPIKEAYWHLSSLMHKPVDLVMQGTKDHLWFLNALIWSLGISYFFLKKQHNTMLIFISVVLYLTGILAKAYSNTPLGLHLHFNTRNGPFFGTIFFVSGYFLSRFNPNSGWFKKGMGLFGLGIVVHFSEICLLWKLYKISPYQDYVVGTYFMGVGIAVASLSNIALWENLCTPFLTNLSRFTLGIYGVHFIFVDLLRPISQLTAMWLWQIGYVAAVFFLSAVSVMLLSKNKLTRRIIE